MCDQDQHPFIAELNEIAVSRQSHMLQNYQSVRNAYRTPYGLPDLDAVRREVALCIILGLYQAAITLTNHLLESLLKCGLMYDDVRRQPPEGTGEQPGARRGSDIFVALAAAKRKYVDKDLSETINIARKMGLITKEQKKLLHQIREDFRNAYSHADKDKTFGDGTIPVTVLDFGGDKVTVASHQDVRLADFLVGHGPAQVTHARQNALPYFQYVDGLAREVLAKAFAGMAGHTDGAPQTAEATADRGGSQT